MNHKQQNRGRWNSNRGWHGGGHPRHRSQNNQESQDIPYPSYSHIGGSYGGWSGMNPPYSHMGGAPFGGWNKGDVGRFAYGEWNESVYPAQHPMGGYPYGGWNGVHPPTYNQRDGFSNRGQIEVCPVYNHRGGPFSTGQNEVRPTYNHRGGSSHRARGHSNTTRGFGNTTRGGGNVTRGGGNMAGRGGNSTRGGGNITRGGGNIARGGGNSTRGGGNIARGGGNITRGGGNTTRGGGNISRGGGNITRGGGNTTRGGGNSTKGGGNITRGGGNTKQGGGNTMGGCGNTTKGSGPTTKGHRQFPRGDRDYGLGQEMSKDKDCLDGNRPTSELQQQFLDFPFIQHCETVRLLRQFRVMFILRGAPGSGKSTVASAILRQAGDEAVICCADDFRYNENGEYVWLKEELEETHGKCKQKAEKFAGNGKPSIVIDNTNVKIFEVEPYVKIARQYGYVVVLVEPKTPWKRQAKELARKTLHNVPVGKIDRKIKDFDEILPHYFGWFLSPEDSVKMPQMAEDILLKGLQISEFQDFIKAFAGRSSREFTVDDALSYYSIKQQLEPYHVTACFSPRGKFLAGAPYHKARAVVSALGQISFLSIVGFVVTKDSFSARVSLASTQRKLWFNDAQRQSRSGQGYSRVVSPRSVREMTKSLQKLPLEDRGRAGPVAERLDNYSDASTHITLGTSKGVNPVQAKHDVQAVINLEIASEGFEEYAFIDGGAKVRKYNEDVWALYFDKENIMKLPAIFSGHYAQRIDNDFAVDCDDFDSV